MNAAAERIELARRRARERVAELEAERRWLEGEHGPLAVAHLLGEVERDALAEVEAELDRTERALRRVRAAAAYLE